MRPSPDRTVLVREPVAASVTTKSRPRLPAPRWGTVQAAKARQQTCDSTVRRRSGCWSMGRSTHPVVVREYPVLAEALLAAASAQLRTMATIGGNIPAAHPLPVLPRGDAAAVQPAGRRFGMRRARRRHPRAGDLRVDPGVRGPPSLGPRGGADRAGCDGRGAQWRGRKPGGADGRILPPAGGRSWVDRRRVGQVGRCGDGAGLAASGPLALPQGARAGLV